MASYGDLPETTAPSSTEPLASSDVGASCYVKDDDIQSYTCFDDMPLFNVDDDAKEELAMQLLAGIEGHGFHDPRRLQALGIVPLYQRRNLIAQSQSGTGKTGCFVIGSLSLVDPTLNQTQVVVIAPTHELASQIYHVFLDIGSQLFAGRKEPWAELCVGKQVSVDENIMNLCQGRPVVIGTPGRIQHLVRHGIKGQPLIPPKFVKLLVLDEADKLLSEDTLEVTQGIVDLLDHSGFRDEGDFLRFGIFSATFNSEQTIETARTLCMPDWEAKATPDDPFAWKQDAHAPLQILLKPDDLTLDGIEQFYIDLNCGENPKHRFESKVTLIETLNKIRSIPTCIVYCQTGRTAEDLAYALSEGGMKCQAIHGKMSSRDRMEITKAFRKQEFRILIATDLLARGFDVSQISMVINFDLPHVYDRHRNENDEQKLADYLHRIGRSGRFGKKGVAINLIADARERNHKRIIEEFYGKPMEELPDDVTSIY